MVDEVRDLQASFNNVYIGRKEKGSGEVTPVYVETFYTTDNGELMIRTLKDGDYKDSIFEKDDYILDCPQMGMLFDGEKVYYARRTPERQWKHGLNNNVVCMGLLSKVECRELNLKIHGLMDKEIINFIYNPKFVAMQDGVASMKGGKMYSFPLSRKFAVGIQNKSKYPVVFYKDWIVGWVQEDTIHLTDNTHHLFEELSQYAACRRA